MADIKYYDVILKPVNHREIHERHGVRKKYNIPGSSGSKQDLRSKRLLRKCSKEQK